MCSVFTVPVGYSKMSKMWTYLSKSARSIPHAVWLLQEGRQHSIMKGRIRKGLGKGQYRCQVNKARRSSQERDTHNKTKQNKTSKNVESENKIKFCWVFQYSEYMKMNWENVWKGQLVGSKGPKPGKALWTCFADMAVMKVKWSEPGQLVHRK